MSRKHTAAWYAMGSVAGFIILLSFFLDLSIVPWWAFPVGWFIGSCVVYIKAVEIIAHEATNDIADKIVK